MPDGVRLSHTTEGGFEVYDSGKELAKPAREETIAPQAQPLQFMPGDCEACPAGATWEIKGPGLLCFHLAWFRGKSGPAQKCDVARRNCPLTKDDLDIARRWLRDHES